MIERQFDEVLLRIFDDREEMGAAAARDAAACIRALLERQEEINCIFAAAPSQNEFLAALCADPSVPWERVNAYHMDEYIGLPAGDPRGFGQFLTQAVFGRVPFKSVNLIDGTADPEREAERYAALLQRPFHITFMGIGENGHIAFNDPHVADFADKASVKVVTLDETCRRQQVNDGCFATLDEVPRQALTVTCPKLMESGHVFCIVPGGQKRAATVAALTGPVSEACPASILRRKKGARMYIDRACAGSLAQP